MSFTHEQLAKLRENMASGIKSLTLSDGRQRTFQNLSEMIELEKHIEAQLNKEKKRTRIVFAGVRRG